MSISSNSLLSLQIELYRENFKPTMTQLLELAPNDKLGWAPGGEMITLGNIFVHVAEASDWWYSHVMRGREYTDLMEKPDSPVFPKAEIAGHLEKHWRRLEELFNLDEEAYSQEYKVVGRYKTYFRDGYWVFTRLFSHELHHRSQICQYLRLLGIEPTELWVAK